MARRARNPFDLAVDQAMGKEGQDTTSPSPFGAQTLTAGLNPATGLPYGSTDQPGMGGPSVDPTTGSPIGAPPMGLANTGSRIVAPGASTTGRRTVAPGGGVPPPGPLDTPAAGAGAGDAAAGSSAAVLGNGWDQFANDPKSFQAGLRVALARGLTGDDAIDWMDANGWKGAKNPSGGGIQYYPESGMFGIPGGYKVTPAAGGKLDIYHVDDGDRSSGRGAGPAAGMWTFGEGDKSGQDITSPSPFDQTTQPVPPPTEDVPPADGIDPGADGDASLPPAEGELAGPGDGSTGPDNGGVAGNQNNVARIRKEFFDRYARPGGAGGSPDATRNALMHLLGR